jgi:hypothetical protein
MLKLLKINTTLLFIILTLPWVLTFVYGYYYPGLSMIFTLISFTIFLIWFLGLDAELMKRIPLKIRPSNTLFLINTFLVYLAYCVISILLDPGQTINVTGLAALPFLYIFYAWFSIYNHLSKLLAYSEDETEVPLNKRVGDMILFFFFFIGVWWLQPRIKKVLEKPEIIKEKYVSMKESESISKQQI